MHQPRPYLHHAPSRRDHQCRRAQARCLLPLLAWICGITASLSLRYTYYGNRRLVFGPNSSRLMKTSSLFVKEVQVKEEGKEGALLYRFDDRPELGLETNWTMSGHLFIDTFDRQGFSMWLNKGSKMRMSWRVAFAATEDVLVVVIKGEEKLEELQRYYIDAQGNSKEGRIPEYIITEDDIYYCSVVNLTPQSIVMSMNINISSKMYETSKATSICSTSSGACKLKLLFPDTQYYVLATSDTDRHGSINVWKVEVLFIERWSTYILLTGLVVGIIAVILHQLGVSDPEERTQEQVAAEPETEPIMPTQGMSPNYGTNVEEPQSSSTSSSEYLNNEKVCVICYDERRNCFFIPCGHSVTCCTCAQRIMEGNKFCPICRRLVHKSKRLLSP